MTDKHFIDWESNVFGYGYGDGEKHIFTALSYFFNLIPGDDNYDFRVLENNLGKSTAWLLINILCRDDIIVYGGSPRFGWLSKKGIILKEYMTGHTIEELCKIIEVDDRYTYCFPDLCQCDINCNNPLFSKNV